MAHTQGEELFTPLLQRRREVERDRNALNVLTMYKFLYNLPQRYVQAADWRIGLRVPFAGLLLTVFILCQYACLPVLLSLLHLCIS